MKQKIALSKYRIENAKEKIESAEILFKNSKFKDSVSRSYYAMFSAAKALLAIKGLNSTKHSGIISLFNQYFVKIKMVGKVYGRALANAKDIREESDYGDYVLVSKEEASEQLKKAKEFISEIEKALKNYGINKNE